MCAHETYMDCPYYEQLQYGGDTRLEILATYSLRMMTGCLCARRRSLTSRAAPMA